MNRIGTIMLLAILVVQGTPIKYCYSGEVNNYDVLSSITMEIVSDEEIRTFELPVDNEESTGYVVNYEVVLQNLTIGETDLVSAPITGWVDLTYGSFGYWFNISFNQDDVNLVLYSEEEHCHAYNPVPGFRVFYSFDKYSGIMGDVHLSSVHQVPEPSCLSMAIFTLPFLLLGGYRRLLRY